ncbi:MAG: aminotransferase class I/II-fold pyridoxal phosphate-dependent enzyme [Bacteroidales bacterium]|jgi:aspartate/methionine/tyrosine aminotransferase|nr:aminotransferase class I/II-fold pyridoxal phosphate-dependent enzyme [Bacteroidales bacterium]MCI1784967.1 aminotransferase class I/II-fold pyridoxal phosphate-dependent enzyme [Bacteroidales bacterium]
MIIKPAQRTQSVKEYYFSRKLKEIDSLNSGRKAAGADKIVNLGIGAPDGMPPAQAIKALTDSAALSGNHAYQSYIGIPELREAFASWYGRYYKTDLDPETEIQPLVGSKEGILLISLAFVDKGDKVLVPDPGYPTYSSASKLVEAEIVTYDLKEENHWLPDFEALEKQDLSGVKIMWTNYPHMPTGAKATPELYQRLADFGNRHNILIVNDNPYSFILNDNPLSLLAADGAKKCCLELNSLSKAYNMSGWRIGMAAGSSELISQVLKVKSQMDSGMFKPLQLAAVEALSMEPEWFASLNAEYSLRRAAAGKIFDAIGAAYDKESCGMFLWGRIDNDNPLLEGTDPAKCPGERVSDNILYNAGVFITPGLIFGKNGNDYIRISLCAPVDVLEDAGRKIEKILKK